jgi:hypothetical protein
MIRQRFQDDHTHAWMRVDRPHPSQEFYVATYEDDSVRLRIDLTAINTAGLAVRIIVNSTHVFSLERQAWLAFSGPTESLNGICRLLVKWASETFSAPPKRIAIADARRETDPLINAVLEPLSADALKALASTFHGKRNGN